MKVKNLFRIVPFLLLPIIIISCSSPVVKTTIPANFNETAKLMADNLITGLEKQDYAIFSKDFDEKMVNAVPNKAMAEIYKLLWNQNGDFKSLETKKTFEEKGYFIVLYNLIFEKGNLDMQVVFAPNPPHKISGLWFPPK